MRQAEDTLPGQAANLPRVHAGTTSSPAILATHLVKRYRSTTALDGLSMEVPRGEIFGFLGPNGAGKTTAVKLLVGLLRPTAGEALILGAPPGSREVRRRIGYLPELFRYQDWLSAREVLLLHCRLSGIAPERHQAEIREALHTVGLASRANDRVGTFSKGMQQRLGLGVALLGRPELIFLDEPTSALDPVGRHDVREIIRSLKAAGSTVFLNSHLLGEVEQVCDRVAIINHGRVLALGTMEDLRAEEGSVEMHVGGLQRDALSQLSRFGRILGDGERVEVQGIPRDAVPDLVAEVVRMGGRVYSVDPSHRSLEDRFLELLGGGMDGDPDDRAPDPS